MATVAQLAARVLRHLGVSLVAQGDRATPAPTITDDDVAALALRELGIPVAEQNRPTPAPAVSQAATAAAALRYIGIGQTSTEAIGTVPALDIAARALRVRGVNPATLTPGALSSNTATLDGIARRALLKLAVYDSGETPAAADLSDTVAAAASIHDMLAQKDFVTWPATAIPSSVAEHYVTLVANVIAPQHGKPASLDVFNAAQAEIRIMALTGAIALDRALATVTGVHAEMAGDGLVDWPIGAIPAGAAEHYAVMTADLMAPVYDKARDPDLYAEASARVRRVAMSGSLGLAEAQSKIRAVHEALNAQGLVSWPVSLIPAGFVEDYAAMAAPMLLAFIGVPRDAPNRQIDEAARAAAEERIRSAARIAGAQARAKARVASIHAELSSLGVASWPLNAIPAAMGEAYATAIASTMTTETGKAADPAIMAAQYRRIRMIAMNGPAGQALAEQKVREVHYDLEAKGRITWSLLDIPRYAEMPYVLLAAALLAPEMDMQPNLPEVAAADRSLYQLTELKSSGEPVRAMYF